jgi:hypothetical protein
MLSGFLVASLAAVACARRAPEAPADSFAPRGLTGVGVHEGGRSEGVGLCPECAGEGLAKLRIGAIEATGNLPREVIQEVVRQDSAGLLRCYKRGLGEAAELQGHVTIVFVIANSGAVIDATNGNSDLPNAAVIACVIKDFASLRFPAPSEGEVHVVFPLQFFAPVRKAVHDARSP